MDGRGWRSGGGRREDDEALLYGALVRASMHGTWTSRRTRRLRGTRSPAQGGNEREVQAAARAARDLLYKWLPPVWGDIEEGDGSDTWARVVSESIPLSRSGSLLSRCDKHV